MSGPKLTYPCIDQIIAREGGYVDDPLGGPTNMGITLRTLRRFREDESLDVHDIQKLPRSTARKIYREMYVVEPGFGGIKDRWFRGHVVDAGVLHGPGTAKRWLQEAAGVKVDFDIGPITLKAVNKADSLGMRLLNNAFAVKRIVYIGKITQDDPENKLPNLEGWLIRATAFLR